MFNEAMRGVARPDTRFFPRSAMVFLRCFGAGEGSIKADYPVISVRAGCMMSSSRCTVLETGCTVLETGCTVLETGCTVLETGCTMKYLGCIMVFVVCTETY